MKLSEIGRRLDPTRYRCLPAATAIALSILVGCDGDDGGHTPTSGPQSTVSGVVAAGLPLAGTITVKDATGATRSAAIGTNGSYSIDVSGMTAPFVFRAEGSAGGRDYTIHSAAVAADVGGVINVTPLTDLAVSNIAGEVARGYFDRGNFSALTPAELAAELQQLRTRLLPVLQSLGIDSSVDLLRTPFTPLSSALDKAIDILRVDYAAGVATITNVVTKQQIQDNLALQAAAEAGAPALADTGGVSTAASDIDQIRAALDNLAAKFSTGLPAVGEVRPLFSADFLHSDERADSFLAGLTTESTFVGGKFTDAVIRSIDYSNPARPLAEVSFHVKGPGGNLVSTAEHWKLVKNGGNWLMHGNQRVLDIDIRPHMFQTVSSTGTCRGSGLSIDADDDDASNNGGVIAYVKVTGPGLPAEGVRARGSSYSAFFSMANTCSSFALAGVDSIPDNAIYTLTAHSADDRVLHTYTETARKRPLTLTELTATNRFPSIMAPTFAAFQGYAGGVLALQIGNMDPLGMSYIELFAGFSNNASSDVDDWRAVTSAGTVLVSLTIPVPGGATVRSRRLEVSSYASDGRTFETVYSP